MKCGRHCALPDCKRDLFHQTDEQAEINISEIAHIIGFSKNGPRADKNLSDSEKNSEKNLMMICATCHKIIDAAPQKYTVDVLRKIKQEHEEEIQNQMKENIQHVSFPELNDLLEYLASDVSQIQNEYVLIKPDEKIKKNNLSEQISELIIHGMIGSKQVSLYLEQHPNLQQGNKISKRFVNEYERLRDVEKIKDDELFYQLYNFASLYSNKNKKTRAGLSVLTYLFEKCEVFEK